MIRYSQVFFGAIQEQSEHGKPLFTTVGTGLLPQTTSGYLNGRSNSTVETYKPRCPTP